MADEHGSTAGAASVSAEDINAIRERIRMEERSKLQSKLEKLETMATENQHLTAQINEVKGQLAKTQTSFDTLQASVKKDDNSVDVAKLIREVSDKADKRYQEHFSTEIANLKATIGTMQTANQRLLVDNYRQKRMSEEQAKGTKFIRELVTGNTEAEIEQSLMDAIEKFKSYFGGSTAIAAPTPQPQTVAQPGVAPVRAPVEAGNAALQPTAPGNGEGAMGIVQNLTGRAGKKLFAENREALLDAATREHSLAQSAGPAIR